MLKDILKWRLSSRLVSVSPVIVTSDRDNSITISWAIADCVGLPFYPNLMLLELEAVQNLS